MLAYSLRRFGSFALVLLLVSVFAFSLAHLMPGDPAFVLLGQEATKAEIEALREDMGLNDPLLVQYGQWLGGAIRGDLGRSLYGPRFVADEIIAKFPVTASIALFTLIIACTVGISAGIVAALKQGTWLDRLSIAIATLGISIPEFWLGLTLILVFSVMLGWFPVGGYVPLRENPARYFLSITLPSLALGLKWAALVARMTRTALLEVLNEDYVRTARSKGLRETSVVVKHAIRNAMIPIVTVVGLVFGITLGGAIIIETVFNLPGTGRLLINAISRRDYGFIQGIVLCYGGFYCIVNLLVDLAYVYLDPRIKYE